jgi:tight adherence protein C
MAVLAGALCCVAVALGALLLAVRRLRGEPAPHEPAVGTRGHAEGARRGRGRLRALGAILRPGDEEELELLRSRTTRAGLRGQDAVDLFLTARLVALAAGLGLIMVAISRAGSPLMATLWSLVIGGLVVVLPGAWLDRRAARRQAAVARELPGALELLVVCLDAGLGIEQALERVALARGVDAEAEILRGELRQVLGDLRVGVPLEGAFRRFAARIGGQEAKTLAAVITRATAMGARVGDLLRTHADKLRRHQLLQAEELAGKASAKLALPLTICLLPAGMLLLLGPAFFEIFKLL